MKFHEALKAVEKRRALAIAQAKAEGLGIDWQAGVKFVFLACMNHTDLAPSSIGTKYDTEKDVIEKWVQKYYDAYNNRISIHRSNLPSTIADPVIEVIIKGRLTHLDDLALNKIKYAHRLSMSAENILGLLLEEYLATMLISKDWHCAWGETIRSVDFCSSTGELLQIKNRSNSENSSSSRVRMGTSIEKWFRIDAISGGYQWKKLNSKYGVQCSEESFRAFVLEALSYNPEALAIEPDNPWQR